MAPIAIANAQSNALVMGPGLVMGPREAGEAWGAGDGALMPMPMPIPLAFTASLLFTPCAGGSILLNALRPSAEDDVLCEDDVTEV
eukprot:CAMPEP_0174735218 /NCGR_PEP_ID=MMETSP1094-20130205/64590_1 /TAXON_ID=156173 /ORGANISM="Chrysochromulina brevifilum, Strain UTEX LB 985" /LENGTH=85 /DNA_ID=CAMNT_0015938155 /DNA_START=129 /DNA_END=382 /DNA_ORIENTATION=-